MKLKSLLLLFALLSLHLYFLTHLKFTAWPEMFSYPYLKNHGFLLYQDMVHPYPPVLTLTLAYLYKFFGYKLFVLEWFSWIVVLFSTVCVWLLARQVGKSERAGIVAATCYVFLQPFLEGNMLWFDIAIVPPVLLGLFFLLKNNLFASGLFFALAAFTKQTAGLFYIAVLAYLIWRDRSHLLRRPLTKRVISFLLGPLIFGIPLLFRLWQEGALIGFWKWVVLYPAMQWSKFPGYVQMSLSRHQVAVLAILSFSLIIIAVKNWKILKHPDFFLLSLLSFVGILAVYPRFSFFHFQIVLAFWAVFVGILLLKTKFSPTSAIVYALFIFPVVRTDWGKEARFYNSEDKKLAAQIKEAVGDNQTVFLQGFSSQYYVLSNTLPPKPWADNFSWYWEISGVQEEILSKWSNNSPLYLVWRIPKESESLLGRYQPEKIVNYLSQNYTKEQELKNVVWVWRKKQ